MLIDVNAYLGHFAFRQLRHNTADGLLRLMDAKGIDRAVVSSASAITYRNAQSGNEELAAAIKPHADRLIGLAVINPFYAGWQDDLQTCHEAFGMKGLRLYPNWHKYKPTDARCSELVDAATERGLIVSLSLRAEDERQRSWLVDVRDLTAAEVAPLVKAKSRARFLLVNGIGFAGSPLVPQQGDAARNCWIEISRLSAVMGDEIGQLLARLGADRVVFGTGMPFTYPDPALVKLEVVKAPVEDKEKVRWRNAAALLGVS
jgi:uncharacterized protein